uniref:Uncharacterized protein n=1 Tax=Panagrolaimus sp. ES5 TaxID=591445 RepID=A0AC34FQU3_9BILA
MNMTHRARSWRKGQQSNPALDALLASVPLGTSCFLNVKTNQTIMVPKEYRLISPIEYVSFDEPIEPPWNVYTAVAKKLNHADIRIRDAASKLEAASKKPSKKPLYFQYKPHSRLWNNHATKSDYDYGTSILSQTYKHAVQRYYETAADLDAAFKEFDEAYKHYEETFPQKKCQTPEANDENSPPLSASSKTPSNEPKTT